MNESTHNPTSRREFLKSTGQLAAASALAGVVLPHVHAAEDNTLQVALVGCGGRGTGAAANALGTSKQGPIKLTAMADVFQRKMDGSYNTLNRRNSSQVDVPPERKFIGFDAYKNAMDCLKPGDIAIFTTPLAFRWVHFTYAIERGLNVFMEKPLTADGPTSRRMIGLAEQASGKNLKVGVGLMSRHSRALQELHHRIQDGEIGDLVLLRGYRMHGGGGSAFSDKWPGTPSELLWQISRFHSFIWASGGLFSDFYIHHVDHLCWMKNAWPVSAQAIGGRHYRESPNGGTYVDQNFDSYSVEYIFEDGARFIMDGRCIVGCKSIYNSYVHGTKGSAIVSKNGDCGLPSSTFSGQNPDRSKQIWTSEVPSDQQSPYQNEWDELVSAIRNDRPYNEVKRGVEASVVASMGRRAAHSGQEITFDQMMNAEEEYAPGADKLTMESPAFLMADANGRYPIPEPGRKKSLEY
ncbi:MAG: Gfo/Idh/MocA family oxidoreductase [Verrucomicrobia bacterium]|nr:Gfo/Idh/MocA family oxidoreductase [Verrucomicrobiota bacterium]